ncbi:hypothetical protein FZEAL_2063 [Fusarium zealandicum]|uniref:Uncharacterized protein n=1 Tax=Fusarium zealandicum TaxID=1053134 RepID=A0A8H4URL4_9HYPO|nr:hypothetical protein FZEAL_2063 [Fusarium zealandicum]
MAEKQPPSIQPQYEPVNNDDYAPYHPSNRNDAPSGSDFTEQPKHNVAVYATGASYKQTTTVAPSKWRLKTLLKKWKLQILSSPLLKESEGQVPIVKDRLTATLTAMIHLPAIAGIITLSFYIFKNYYIGKELEGKPDYDSEKMLGIQLAAKLMEMFIVLSLNAIVFAMIRHEFTLGQSVPYGALVAGQQISDISFLWSDEFFSIIKGKFSQTWKKLAFIFTILVFAIMALGASSLSAVAMMPQEGEWRAGGSPIYFNATRDEIFPGVLTEDHTPGAECNRTGNKLCPSWQWDVINTQLVSKLGISGQVDDGLFIRRPPRELYISGPLSTLVNLVVDVREKWFNLNSPNHTVASMPHFGPAEACVLSSIHWEQAADISAKRGETRFNSYTKLEHKLDAPLAISHTRCERTSVDPDNLTSILFPDFVAFPPVTLNVSEDAVMDWLSDTLPDIRTPEVLWFDSGPVIANSSIGAVVALPSQSNNSVDVYGCMIDARWITSSMSGDSVALLSKGYAPFSDPIATSLGASWISNPVYGQRVRIEPEFAQYLNPVDVGTNRTIIHEMLLSSGIWTSKGGGSKSSEHLEAILGGLTTNGLARTSPNASAITTLANPDGEWWKAFMPQNGSVFGPGGDPYAVSEEDQARFYATEMETWVTGFAFADNSLTMRGAMAVFYCYALFVLAYSIWSIWTGITSSSWESVPDLLALALADKKDPGVAHEDAFSGDVMTENYCISAEGSTLRLRTTHGLVPPENRVKPNEAYD